MNLTNDLNDLIKNSKFDVSIAIASAVTAYARMYMTLVKNNANFKLYYNDTDSAIIDQPLQSSLIGDELGEFKLEFEISEGVFLCPKVYGIIYIDSRTNTKQEVVKIKGAKNPISFNSLKDLLKLNEKKEINQAKWYRDISNGSIYIKDELYTLVVTESKRQLIF